MNRSLLLISFLLLSILTHAECTILCRVKYYHKIYHEATPNATMKTETLGTQPIFGTGRDAYYEDVWSNTYTLNVSFYSGYEFNDTRFEINDIIAIVKWNGGGYSTIKIEGWSTDTKYITE